MIFCSNIYAFVKKSTLIKNELKTKSNKFKQTHKIVKRDRSEPAVSTDRRRPPTSGPRMV